MAAVAKGVEWELLGATLMLLIAIVGCCHLAMGEAGAAAPWHARLCHHDEVIRGALGSETLCVAGAKEDCSQCRHMAGQEDCRCVNPRHSGRAFSPG